MQLHVAMYKFKDVVQHVLEGLDEYFKMYFQQQQMQSQVIECVILSYNCISVQSISQVFLTTIG
jgi:hypothetical protein